MPLTFDDDAGKEQILETGEYGANEDANILSIVARNVPGDQEKNPNLKGVFYEDICVVVEHPDMGRVFVHTSPYGRNNTQLGENTGSKGPTFNAQLGIGSPEFADEPDEKGNHALIGESMENVPVIVQVKKNIGKDGVARNEIANIFLKQ